MSSKLLKGFLIVCLLAVFGVKMSAQPFSSYIVSESVETWTPITGTLANPPGGGSLDWGATSVLPIGFTFPFDNRTFTTWSADVNGHMKIGGAVTMSHGLSPVWSTVTDHFAPYTWDAVSNITYDLVGSAPNRCLVIQWNAFSYWIGVTLTSTMQCRLYENGMIKFVYGPGFTALETNNQAYIYACGDNQTTDFKGINPGNPSAFTTVKGSAVAVTQAARANLVTGKTYTFVGYPVLADAYPANASIVMLDQIYANPSALQPGFSISNYQASFQTFVNYEIVGPGDASNPNYQTIYRGINPALPSTDPAYYDIPVTAGGVTRINNAVGIAAGANGALDLLTNRNSITPGLYKVKVKMKIPAVNYEQSIIYDLNVAYSRDLAVGSINSPRSNVSSKYPLNTRLPVVVSFANLGVLPITSFRANVKIYYQSTNTLIYDNTLQWDTSYVIGRNPLQLQGVTQMEFPQIMPTNGVGHYRVEVTATLLNPTPDDQLSNNIYPTTGNTYYFDLAHDIELEAVNIVVPSETVSLGRPLLPLCQVKNNGISDIPYQIPGNLKIYKINTDNSQTLVYDSTAYLDAIPAYPSGVITSFIVNKNFVPTEAGNYVAVLSIIANDDPVQANNTFTKNFTVLPGLNGTYTIGTLKPGIDATRNYLTIPAAIADLYLKGISGSVVFELTDKTYNVTSLGPNNPAIDLSSKIVGNNATNTIKFKPNAVNSLNAGDVVINMLSSNGIGVLLGQNVTPSNSEAAVYSVLPALKKNYANGSDYITFDGGANKSLKFVLNTVSPFKAGFYLGQGASNNAINNCIIEDASTNSDNCTIPMTRYNATNRAFEFQKDNGTQGTYSAGIVMRSIAPYDTKQYSIGKLENPNKLDTASNNNNVISGNTISGFGYGIVSLGIGVLEKVQAGIGVHTKYYNTNNTISGNTIYNVSKGGIFLGFEQNSAVANNRIYNVFNQCGTGAAGIIAGSDPSNNYLGYNNIGVAINGNEISDVNTNVRGAGIYVTQSLNAYPKVSSSEFINFPDVAESMLIVNNAIWGFDAQTATDSKAGIVLQTGRGLDMTSPAIGTYRTRNDVIANNTVIINEDGFASTDNQAALMIQQATNTKVVNNALANNDNTYAAGNVAPLMYYYNEMPSISNVMFDRNVYYNVNSNSDMAYVKDSKTDGSVEYTTSDGELRSIYQWQIASGQDANSSVYNFLNDLTVTTTNKLRIKTSPSMPVGSKLNNNGYKFNEIKINTTTTLLDKVESKDLTLTLRSAGGKRTDIGAFEFDGQLRLNDLEVVGVTSPAVYKSVLGDYSDNQYVMTTAPVEIKAMIRNNGNLPENNVPVMAIVYRQWPNGQYVNNNEVIADTFQTYINVGSNENVIANFYAADGKGHEFVPETYSDLRTAGYVCPSKYAEMVTNVTPIYKIEIIVNTVTDLDNTNNVKSEQYRFYIKRSTLNLLVSAENVTADKNSATITNDVLAGKLNYDSLKAGINRLGWTQETMTEPKNYDFDVFDRTTWEPKSVNYEMYKNLFWSDGNDKTMDRQTEKDIRAFLSNASTSYKKNLVIASQEMLRMNLDKSDFTNNILKSVNKAPNSPLNGASYSNNRVIGSALSIGKRETIKATGFTNAVLTDAEPNPALMGIVTTSQLPKPAYIFETRVAGAADSLAGVATAEMDRNVIYLGIDWRHWANLDTLLRGITDYNTRNGSEIVIPIELIDFDAIALNNRVEISWSTASEINTDRFEVERALVSPVGISNFSVIAREAAAGNSQSTRNYGPVVDRNVNNGSTYIYRLRTIDKDGASSLSEEVEVTLDGANALGTVNPNPAQTGVNLDFTASGEVTINIYDLNGKLVKEIYNGTASGSMNITFDVTGLSSGSYTIVMQSGKEFFSRQLFVRK